MTVADRNYETLFPKVLAALYPARDDRDAVTAVLSRYGEERHHQEAPRIHVGILRLAGSDRAKLEELTRLACEDFRDLLCMAEYPLTSGVGAWEMKKKNPEKYRALQMREQAEYDQWISGLLGN